MLVFIRRLLFGLRVFFSGLNFKNFIKIIRFLWSREISGKPVPFSVVFGLTYKCQCDCVHCSIGDYKKEDNELSNEEVKRILDFIDAWGPIKITFFGGEPLIRNDIVDLVSYCSQKGLRISLDTNGLLLDENTAIALKKAGISNINVSIDSNKSDVHDLLRRKNGSFNSAVRAMELCVNYKIPCLLSTYASKRAIRERELEKIVKLARTIGVRGVKILFPILSGKWRSQETERLDDQEEKYVQSILDPDYVYIEDALEMVKKGGKGCSAMERNLIYISPYGDIQPCPAIPVSFGNIRQEPIKIIVKRMSRHRFFEKYRSCKICLMNEINFRKKFFSLEKKEGLLINAGEF